jgi:hypothetical protein
MSARETARLLAEEARVFWNVPDRILFYDVSGYIDGAIQSKSELELMAYLSKVGERIDAFRKAGVHTSPK